VALPDAILYDMTLPRALDITIRRGDTFAAQLAIETAGGSAVNLTGLTGAGTVRDAYDGTALATMTVTHDNAGGIISVTIAATVTAEIEWPENSQACAESAPLGVWDLQLSDGTDVRTVVSGKAYLARDVAP
jgi:hypothetical protein